MSRDDPFVGRERELAALRAALGSAGAGRGRVALLVGEPGIGKTRITEEVAKEARAGGAEVLVGRCYEGEGAPAFWPWLQVLETYVAAREAATLTAELGEAAADVAGVCPAVRLRLPALGPTPGGDPERARFRFFDGVTRALGRAAAVRPIVVVLDDLHGADRPSLLLLQFLARALPVARILVVGALRDVGLAAEHPLAEALGELVRERVSEWLRLGGLDQPAVGALIEALAAEPPPAGLAAAVHARTEGNPLYVTEVVRALLAGGRLPATPSDGAWRLPVPETVRATIARRLAQRSAECREVLTLAALFGREFPLDALTRASGRAAAVLAAIDEAETARLVTAVGERRGRYRFAHALVNETLVDALGPARRSALHREAAAALAADPRAEELAAEIAHHYHAAGPAGEPAAAVAWAARAGERAVGLLAYEEAVRLYQLALEAHGWCAPDALGEAGLLLALGDARKRASDVEAAKATFLRAAELGRRVGAPDVLTRAALGFAPAVTYAEQPAPDAAVTSLLEEAIAAWDERDSGLHACALARLALALFFGDPARRHALVERAVAMARRLGDSGTLRYVLATKLSVREPLEHGEERLATATELASIAEAAGDLEALALARVWRVVHLLEGGDAAAADADLAALERLADKLRQPTWTWRIKVLRGLRAVMDGRFMAAERDIGDARVVGESAGMPYAAPVYFVGQMLLLRLLQGAADDIARFAADYRAIFESHPDRAAMAMVAHAEAELGHEAEARRIVEELAGDDFRAVRTSPVRLVAATLVASACASLDDVERAASLYGLLRTQPAQCVMWMEGLTLGPITHHLGLLARTMGQLDAGAAHFEDAIAMSARMGARPFLARTQCEYARLLHRRAGPGDTARAAVLVAEAIATADALGMVGLRGRAGALAEAVGAPPAPPPLAAPTPVRAVFRHDGDYWTIDYAGQEVRLRDTNGLQYIAQLLAHPGQDVHVADLAAADNGVNAGRRHAAGDLGAVLDPHAVADYRRRLADLREELDEVTAAADAGRAERVRAEIDVVGRELSAAYGLGGRHRTAGDPAERVRKAVTNQIRRALERIRAAHPALGRHLANGLRTGFVCAYRPEHPIDWQL